MSIFWSWQCLGPSLSRWLPAECCLGVPAAKGYIPNARKRRNTSIRRMVRASRWGRLAALVLPPGGRRHFDARTSPWGAAWGSQFGTQGLLLGHHRVSGNKQCVTPTVPAQQAHPVLRQRWGQAGEGSCSCVQTLLRAHTASSSVLLAFEKEKYNERERLKEAEFVGGF